MSLRRVLWRRRGNHLTSLLAYELTPGISVTYLLTHSYSEFTSKSIGTFMRQHGCLWLCQDGGQEGWSVQSAVPGDSQPTRDKGMTQGSRKTQPFFPTPEVTPSRAIKAIKYQPSTAPAGTTPSHHRWGKFWSCWGCSAITLSPPASAAKTNYFHASCSTVSL